MFIYLLDTNMVTHILKKNSNVIQRRESLSSDDVMVISILTYAEMQYGFAKNPEATKIRKLFDAFLPTVKILPFNEEICSHYGQFKVNVEKQGKSLAPFDMLIAAHADAVGAILVSNDAAFAKISGLKVEDWTQE